MPTKTLSPELPTHSFRTAPELEAFIAQNHSTLPSGFWLRLAKKSSSLPSVTLQEAIEIALCYGWINGQGKSDPPNHFLARYTPRRPKSMWSKINVDMVARLSEEGRMKEPGLKAVEEAKADGRWERAYKSPSIIEVPDDLKSALDEDSQANKHFQTLSKTERYAVLFRIETTSVKNRSNKIDAMVKMLREGRVPGEKERERQKDAASKRKKMDSNMATSPASRKKTKSRIKDLETKQESETVTPKHGRSGLRSRRP